jgi:hypothetical protein
LLAAPSLEGRHCAGQRAIVGERRADLPGECPRRTWQPWLVGSGYSGNFSHSVWTSVRTVAATPSSSGVFSTRAMKSAINSISGSVIPRVVIAGVPIRIPLATIGGFSSNGIAFLFTVMPALPSAVSATLPLIPFENTSTSTM